ncbi:probable G-protein coupled receptor 139 [Narcine bancroftii]|uniref:probable G-protein coupled receptor 139 n=1 Tax=Narcine bancroftii TaxID=1343680 RepID=UPI0038310331
MIELKESSEILGCYLEEGNLFAANGFLEISPSLLHLCMTSLINSSSCSVSFSNSPGNQINLECGTTVLPGVGYEVQAHGSWRCTVNSVRNPSFTVATYSICINNFCETLADYSNVEDHGAGDIRVISGRTSLILNLVAIVILARGKCGLSKCITRYLTGMATTDLLVIISDPLLRQIADIYFPHSFLFITPVCRLIDWLVFAVTAVSVWLTVAFTFDRFVTICHERLRTKYCTERTAAVVIGTVSALCCVETVPWYIRYKPGKLIDNIPWGCVMKQSVLSSPAWAAFEVFHRILTPGVPFVLILSLNILTVRQILAASGVRRKLRGRSHGENVKDPEMENRKKSIILLFSITGSFILLWVTRVVFNIYQRLFKAFKYSVDDPRYITEQTSAMLQHLSSCTNTFIYVLTQSKFREELKSAAILPLRRIMKCAE